MANPPEHSIGHVVTEAPMLGDVLDYQWARHRLIEGMVGIWPQMQDGYTAVESLRRAENLSQRICELVGQTDFDHTQANLLYAREVAYWREWLRQRADTTESMDDSELLGILEMKRRIDEYAKFVF